MKYSNIPNKIGIESGPTYFDKIAQKIKSHKDVELIEWRAKLNFRFSNIRFYGDYKLFDSNLKSLIISTDFSKQFVKALNLDCEEILLFDGCKHGYNSMLCDKFTNQQINNRPLEQNLFPDENQEFEIILSAYYQTNFDEWLVDGDMDEKGMIELIDGSLITLDTLKRDGFDAFEILISDNFGKIYPILQEETA